MSDTASRPRSGFNVNVKEEKQRSPWLNPRVIIMVCFALLVVYLTAGRYVLHKHTAMETQAQKYTQEATNLSIENKEAQLVLADPQQWNTKSNNIAAALPPGRDFPILINIIGQAANQAGVAWQEGSTVPSFSANPGSAPQSFNLSITIVGAPAQEEAFINNIQHVSRMISVASFSIPGYSTNQSASITVQLNVWSWGGPTGAQYPPPTQASKIHVAS